MMTTQIIVKDGLSEPLEKFGAQAPKMLDSVLSSVGGKFRKHIRDTALAGQMLYSRPNMGPLWISIASGKSKRKKHMVVIGSRKVKHDVDMGAFIVRRTTNDAVKLANIYEHAGGYTILPKKGKYLTFQIQGQWVKCKRVQNNQRPFISGPARTFAWPEAIDASSEKVVNTALKKLGLLPGSSPGASGGRPSRQP